MNFKNTLRGIGLFQLEVIHLISIGKKESIADIEESLMNGNLIEYVFNKYKNDFCVKFNNEIYDNKVLNSYFTNYNGYIQGNESRKYGIMNDMDGLLLILALISDKIEECSIDMKID